MSNKVYAGKVGITMEGEWDSAKVYDRLSGVIYQNSLYISRKIAPIGVAPTDGENWALVIEGVRNEDIENITDGTTIVGHATLADNATNAGNAAKLGNKTEAQLSVLNSDQLDGKHANEFANVSHTHTKSQISDFPTSLPASDVPAWAKAETKPSYTKGEVGLGNVDNTPDEEKSVSYAASSGNAAKLGNKTEAQLTVLNSDQLDGKHAVDFANASHTHTKSQISDFPTSLPASDVPAWAKEETKPSYTKGEVGLGNVDNTPDEEKSVSYAASSGNAAKLGNKTEAQLTVLNSDQLDGKHANEFANASHTHTKSQISDFPTSLPASDVYAWAKAETKPSYTKNEVGLGNVDNTPDEEKSVSYATSSGNATRLGNKTEAQLSVLNSDKLDGKHANEFANASHTHTKSQISDFPTTFYTHPTTSGNKHIPSGGASGQILRWSSDGTAAWGNDNNTTYSTATASANGLMSSGDKAKLDGIDAGSFANASHTHTKSQISDFPTTFYTHPTTSGNKHIPSGGASGQILRWSSDGTAAWGNDNNTTYSTATASADGLMSAGDKSKLDNIASGANQYSHPNSGVTAGTYRSVTVNAQGHVTGGSNPTTTVAQGGTGATDASTARTNLGVAYGTTAGTVCQGNDSRLSNARTPTSHNQAASTITAGTLGGQIVAPAGTDYTTNRIRNEVFVTTDPGANVNSSYVNGSIINVYE